MRISYAIPFCGEWEELNELLEVLRAYISSEDEIIVLIDQTKVDPTEFKTRFRSTLDSRGFEVHYGNFTGNFADWKNLLNSYCSGDYIFQIDADELPKPEFLSHLKQVLELNPDVELFQVPRENFVEGLTEQDIKNWRWNVSSEGLINWPDYQYRLYKNIDRIKWQGKVHEKPVGFKTFIKFPATPAFALVHRKSIERQRKQNAYYSTLS